MGRGGYIVRQEPYYRDGMLRPVRTHIDGPRRKYFRKTPARLQKVSSKAPARLQQDSRKTTARLQKDCKGSGNIVARNPNNLGQWTAAGCRWLVSAGNKLEVAPWPAKAPAFAFGPTAAPVMVISVRGWGLGQAGQADGTALQGPEPGALEILPAMGAPASAAGVPAQHPALGPGTPRPNPSTASAPRGARGPSRPSLASRSSRGGEARWQGEKY